jgi:hypothetical protein
MRVKSFTSQATRSARFIRANIESDKIDKADLAFKRSADNSIHIRKDNGDTFIRIHETAFAKVFPEFTELQLGNGRIWRETLVYWESEATNNAQAFFDYDRFSNDSSVSPQPWGLSGDIPIGGDFDGNGSLNVGVFRPSNGTWYIFSSAGANQKSVPWGIAGDKPVPADYDFDGITDYAVYRPSTGIWWILRSSDGGFEAVRFGLENDIPLTGDFDADGKADFTVYRPSEGIWYQLLTTEGFRVIRFGIETDYPVPGDYDGDGRHDIAVFRDGIWYLLQSTEGLQIVEFGTVGDIPVAVRYDE